MCRVDENCIRPAAQELGLACLGKLSVDGTKVWANASKRKANRMREEEEHLAGEIEALLHQADAVDEVEDARLGAEVRGEDRVDTLSVGEVRVKLRAGVDRGSWRQKGDEICAALAGNGRPIVLALDELPILVNRMLKDADHRITPEGRRDIDEFLSWLRRNGQDHRDRICLIVSGSVGLEPILRQAGLRRCPRGCCRP